MYSQAAAVEAVYSTTYVEDYLDAVVDFPDDLQRHLSRLREYDAECNRHVREVERLMDVLMTLKEKNDPESETASISISTMLQSLLVRTQEIGDQKLGVVQQIQDMLESKTSLLDIDQRNSGIGENVTVKQEPVEPTTKFESCEKKRARRARHDVFVQASLGPTAMEATSYVDQPSIDIKPFLMMPPVPSTSHTTATSSHHHIPPAKPGPSSAVSVEKTQERERVSWGAHNERALANASAAVAKVKQQEKKAAEADKKKQYKRRKTTAKQAGNASPPNNVPIDPDEPTYCLCDQVSYGDMIGCDNDLCPIEWFHFSCVSLTTKPKGKWYCPKCRGKTQRTLKFKSLKVKDYKPTTYIKKQIKVEIKEEPVDYEEEPYD